MSDETTENGTVRDLIEAWVEAHRGRIIAETQAILRIPSVEEPQSAGPGAPFGAPVARALAHTLALCDSLGMGTRDFDGYAGHAEFGDGESIAAMLGHLDVVPVGKGWTKDPWGALIEDGRIWARGSSDDKGPTYAALFGAAAVWDLVRAGKIPAPAKCVRLIFGCDEESGWQCMAHYFGAAAQPMPTLAFTPDASFPLIYAEKGSFTAVVEKEVLAAPDAPLRVVSLRSGLRPNMVPDEAVAVLAGDAGVRELAAHVLAAVPDLTVEAQGDALVVTAKGRGAHGSTPEMGDNAAVKLMRALASNTSALDDMDAASDEFCADLALRAAPDGSEVGIGGRDEVTGHLTSNLGIVTLEGGFANATFNIRYPATWDGEATIARFRESLAATGWRVADLHHTPPLYVPQDQEPVKTLLRVYREHTGDMSAPGTMGGRTYATSVAPVGVAFGAALPGDPDVANQADEHFPVERLILCAKIYGHALYELAR